MGPKNFQAVLRIFSVFGDGIARRDLLRILQLLSPITGRELELLLAGSGQTLEEPVDYEAFLRWLFSCKAEKDETSATDEASATTRFGDVFVYGSGDCDQLGLGDAIQERQKPTFVRGLSGVQVRSLACGGLHVICISTLGELFSWGCGDDGALGRPGEECEPAIVPNIPQVVSVACGDSHSCAITTSGEV